MSPVFATGTACLPSVSWSTSITSSLVSTFSVNSSSLVMSPPKTTGAAIRLQRLIQVYCSLCVSEVGTCPCLPARYPMLILSGSFHPPGPAHFAIPAWPRPNFVTLPQPPPTSPAVRQKWPPTSRPHSQTLPSPYWQRL